ncbi:hypothetical protein [Lentibacillus amyloliquefaciens]|uniref:hypothetical protein n=1 Tax=Lentibacillus amyloliquefaciens TaxID=1472767 RepID=UPI0012E37A37|nr:hypothetical protein [Lentibacillus amyloliquefaciens]
MRSNLASVFIDTADANFMSQDIHTLKGVVASVKSKYSLPSLGIPEALVVIDN